MPGVSLTSKRKTVVLQSKCYKKISVRISKFRKNLRKQSSCLFKANAFFAKVVHADMRIENNACE